MGTIVTNIVKTTILRLQRPPACSVMEPIAIEKLDTFHIDRYELGRELNTVLAIEISPAEKENWQTVGDVIETANKHITDSAATKPYGGTMEETARRTHKLNMSQEYGSTAMSYTEAVNKADTIIEHRLRMSDPEYFDFGKLRAGDAVKRGLADRARLIDKLMKGE